MATNIPPHNLTELANITIQLIEKPETKKQDLIKMVPGPDFPTGGTIVGLQGCKNLYFNGQGSLILRGSSTFCNKVIIRLSTFNSPFLFC
jgi:DNA gyrase subunit A